MNDDLAHLVQSHAEYRALAPDWTKAPEGATGYIIHSNGACKWIRTLKDNINLVAPIPRAGSWSLQYVWWDEMDKYVDLPLGVDWRLCKWVKPEVHP